MKYSVSAFGLWVKYCAETGPCRDKGRVVTETGRDVTQKGLGGTKRSLFVTGKDLDTERP